MEIDKAQFERLSHQGQNEEKQKKARQAELKLKWE
jgi:hypothetical protein